MGLMVAGGGTSGPFGNVYFFYVWANFNSEGVFPPSLFSDVSYSNSNVDFTPIKNLNVVLHQESSQNPHYYGKIKIKTASSYENITDGMPYTFEAGTEYTIAYGRDNTGDHPAFAIYANDE